MATPSFAASNPGQNPSMAEYLRNRIDGKSMRALALERQSAIAALKANQTAKPATVLWFNPVPGRLDAGVNFGIPSIRSEFVPEREKLTFTYKAKKYQCTRVTIRDPYVFPWITDVKKEEDVEVGIYKIEHCKQIEIAHAFRVSCTYGAESSSGMGGVLIFEGDLKALERKEKDTGRIVLRVPTYIPLPNKRREYFCEEKYLDEELAKTLDMQKRYTGIQTQQAQGFWDKEDQRSNITDVHRVWHQYEMDMGWRTTAAPWITLTHENQETCVGCGEPKKRAEAYFCKCGRVYDPFKAYMDKEIPMSHDQMARVADDKWPLIRAEEARRKAVREGSAPETK